jgi:hypothetical protein
MQEGGTVDPVSGNDVPVGSTQEEVRDDIPAQLSEGEFVFPADVVRYFGLEKLMEMRQEAKMGLQRMDDMGQMGNSEEAIMPDNLPFDIDDIDMEDDNELEMAQGGVVHMANGGPVGQIGTFNPNNILPGALGAPVGQVGPNIQAGTQVVVYGPDGTAYGNAAIAQAAGVTNYTMTPPSSTPSTPSTPAASAGQAAAPVQAASAQFQPAGTKFTPTTTQEAIPTFKDTIGLGVPYVEYDPNPQDETEEETESPSVDTTTTTQQPQGDGGGGDGLGTAGTGTATVGSISDALGSLFGGDKDAPKGRSVGDIFESAVETNNYFGGSKAFGWTNDELRGATFKQAGAQVGSVGLTGIVSAAADALGLTDFNLKDIGVAGFTGMNNALNSLGLTNRGQLMNSAQASLVGKTMAAAHAAAFKGQDTQSAINKVLSTQEAIDIQDRAYNSIKNAYVEKAGAKGTFTDRDFANEMARVERSAVEDLNKSFNRQSPRNSRPGQDVDSDFRSNVVTDSKGNPVTSKSGNVLTEAGRVKKDNLTAIANQARVNKQQAQKAIEEQRQKDEAQDRAADKAAAEAQFAQSQKELGGYTQGDGGSGGNDDRDTGQNEASAGGAGGGYGLSHAKGGLVSQMKRSGLASKK